MQITDLVYIDATGYHFADYPTFLAWRQDQYRTIYGSDVYLESDSQDGQLIAIQAKSDYDTAALGAAIYNSFSPVTAQGLGLSRNVKINGLIRRVASNSTVDILIVGQTGTVITGGIVIDTLKQKWDVPTTTIPDAGEITVTAVAQVEGALTAEANTVNQIYTPTLGWQTVNNVAAATPGSPVETDAELRLRQALSTANPSLTVLDGTVGGVANLAGVTKVRGYENDTGSTDSNGIPAHKISIIVLGGDAVEIANEIALHKTPGTGTYGSTSETVYDAHGMPLDIHFYRPTPVTITATVTIATNPGWSNDYVDLIKQAVADTINSNQIGDPVLITKLYAPAYLTGTAASASFDIATLEIGKNSDPQGTINIPLLFNEDGECDPTVDVVVVVT
jgi:uncharacterized phage protein gp47/JayE